MLVMQRDDVKMVSTIPTQKECLSYMQKIIAQEPIYQVPKNTNCKWTYRVIKLSV